MTVDSVVGPTFKDLGLSEPVLAALEGVGYENPSPIQSETVPILLEGRDLIGQAQTGTGKTGAFAWPLLCQIDVEKREPQALVLTPTRELAIQVAEAFQSYAQKLPGFHVLPIYGGQPYGIQLRALQRGPQVIVGTPGRVMDHMRRGTLNLSSMRNLVLDEADEMLNMGFLEDIQWILDEIPTERQIAMFSATMPREIQRIAEKYLKNPRDDQDAVEEQSRGHDSSTRVDRRSHAQARRTHAHPRGRRDRCHARLRAHQIRHGRALRTPASPRLRVRSAQWGHPAVAARADRRSPQVR